MHSNHNGITMWLQQAVALAMLLVLLPVGLLIALAIRLDSPGPVLFLQNRVGQMGRTFRIYKFRTMHTDQSRHTLTSERSGVCFKMRRDPRVTRIGYWLRRGSLDELPQLINVVRGDMALIGPRPALPQEVNAYAHDHLERLGKLPGITGLWQVSGRADTTFDEQINLDIRYVRDQSPWLDLSILLRTIPVVLTAKGAY